MSLVRRLKRPTDFALWRGSPQYPARPHSRDPRLLWGVAGTMVSRGRIRERLVKGTALGTHCRGAVAVTGLLGAFQGLQGLTGPSFSEHLTRTSINRSLVGSVRGSVTAHPTRGSGQQGPSRSGWGHCLLSQYVSLLHPGCIYF